VGLNLVSSKILNENGVKVMPGSIPAPNTALYQNKKNTGSQMGHTKKIFVGKIPIRVSIVHSNLVDKFFSVSLIGLSLSFIDGRGLFSRRWHISEAAGLEQHHKMQSQFSE